IVVELIAEVFRVHQNHAFVRHADRGIPTCSGDHINTRLDLLDHLAGRCCAATALSAASIATACIAAPTLTITAPAAGTATASLGRLWGLRQQGDREHQ